MPQSSLMTWLSKPAAVKEPAPAVLKPERREQMKVDLPTPPSPDNNQHTSLPIPSTATPDVEKSFLQSKLRPLPSNVELQSPRKEDIPAFKQINNLLLPIPYPESFYQETHLDELTRNTTLFAFWHDSPSKQTATSTPPKPKLIGAIRCRLFAHPLTTANTTLSSTKSQNEKPMLYLSTLVLLSPYRSHGIAAHLLDVLVRRAVEDYGIGSIGAHVWEANDEGLEWYRKRGFREVGREAGYYRKLKPGGAVVMRREVGVMDLAERGMVWPCTRRVERVDFSG